MRADRRFASGVSLATLAFALGAPHAVRAAAFLGTPATVSGSVSYARTALNSETITVDSARAIVNWTPTDSGVNGAPQARPA